MIVQGDCVALMAELPEGSVDAIVTDPPYGLEFMGKEWDRLGATNEAASDTPAFRRGHGGLGTPSPNGAVPFGGGGQRVRYGASAKTMQEWHEAWAREALRILKPGGHLLAFGGTRTIHRMVCAIEDAGFEIRDMLSWLYGSGFPKSHNLTGEWEGFGTALKPAWEGITLARKPLAGTVAQNVLEHGTGALNVDGSRIGETVETWPASRAWGAGYVPGGDRSKDATEATGDVPAGRWPANVLLDEQAAAMLDEQTGELQSPENYVRNAAVPDAYVPGGKANTARGGRIGYGDSGGASKFFPVFTELSVNDADSAGVTGPREPVPSGETGTPERTRYVAKASSAERNAGLDGFEEGLKRHAYGDGLNSATKLDPKMHTTEGVAARPGTRNVHPTVKPIELMRWLVRLVTPPGGTVLDPFTGSGTTGCAAALEGFNFIGMEREAEYVKIAEARIAWWAQHPDGLEIVKALEADRERKKVADSGQLGLLG